MSSSQAPRYTVYGSGPSRSSRVVWALEELGQPYTIEHVDFYSGGHRKPAFLAVNPNGKVPALTDGDLSLFESAAILTYLGEQHPESGFVPEAGSPEKGLYLQWSTFVVTELEQPLWLKAKHTFALPEALRVPEVIPTAEKEYRRVEKVLARGLEGREYLVGDRFTFADVLAGHTLAWAMKAGFPIEVSELLEYAQRLWSRPAFADATIREQAAKAEYKASMEAAR
ncbi:MAG: glutathione S-transferase family protein [Bradymonadia bacterium]